MQAVTSSAKRTRQSLRMGGQSSSYFAACFDNKSSAPITMNAAPAPRVIQIGGTTRATASPATTAIALVATSASAEAANTVQRDCPDAARLSVASWVLSPSSARKTTANVDANR